MFKVETIIPFSDLENNKKRKPGDTFDVHTEERVRALLGDNSKKVKTIKVKGITYRGDKIKTGEKMIIFQRGLAAIGGIETFIYNFVKHYEDRNITVVSEVADFEQMLRISQYANVMVDDGFSEYECDVALLTSYDASCFMPRVRYKTAYQMIHADFEGLRKYAYWQSYVWKKHPGIKEVITVSETARQGLLNTSQVDSKVIYNILDDDKEDDVRFFITLSRATQEKGIERMVKMAKEFKKQNKKFIWFVACVLKQTSPQILREIQSIPEFMIIPPALDNRKLIGHCDYLVQLSDTESFCYSAYEALQQNVPVILTDFPEAKNIVDDGENGYIVDLDLSNLDVDKIFNNVPRPTYYVDRCDYEAWEQVFKGEF